MLYTEQQAAALLGLHRRTLRRARLRGDIEYTLLGLRGIRYTQAQLDAYLSDCRRRADKPQAEPAPRLRSVPRPSSAAASVALAYEIIESRKQRKG